MQLAQIIELAQINAETYVTQVVPPAPTACFVSSETSYSGDTCTAGSDGEVRITDASTTSAAVTEEGKRCYFCGRSVHSRLKCSARRQTCLKCGKVRHFANVCRSSNRRNIDNASAISLATLTAASTPSTTSSIMTVTVNGEKVNALIDSGSAISFLDSKKAQKLLLPIIPSKDHVTMAQSSLVSNSEGHCLVDLLVKGNLYQTFKFSLLSTLCAEAILGRDFMKLHRSVEFAFSGSKPELTVCGMTCMNLNPPTHFPNLPSDCRPIATPTRRHSLYDKTFIQKEVQNLLQEGVIEKSQSPWRAQTLPATHPRTTNTISTHHLLPATTQPLPLAQQHVSKPAQPPYHTARTLLWVEDLESRYNFLIDSGSEVSVVTPMTKDRKCQAFKA
ncbi:hypothetical protein Pmani_020870 [Petrolisthes manimaculis]|uniref:CCHC-type domain-containing protein n=1 Tax=Petrolisthes manimaculis TaxID=1843537 RepID=A0AAE1PFX3_9EUCA|nr:hypothetical protein Pmani_020870 [Petrolisthes manimaculis]